MTNFHNFALKIETWNYKPTELRGWSRTFRKLEITIVSLFDLFVFGYNAKKNNS